MKKIKYFIIYFNKTVTEYIKNIKKQKLQKTKETTTFLKETTTFLKETTTFLKETTTFLKETTTFYKKRIIKYMTILYNSYFKDKKSINVFNKLEKKGKFEN